MEIRTGIRIDGDAAGAVNASQQTERALDDLAQAGKAAGRDVDAGMAQVTSASRAAGSATDALRGKQEALAKQAKLVAFQNQQLAFQLNDFFVQVASGQSPMIAAIQQGSQLSGTYGGIGNAVRAVTSLITPARLAIGGLTGGVGALALAALQGESQQNQLARSIALTGGVAGQTLGQLDQIAQRASASAGVAIGGVRDTVAGIVSSGKVGAQAIEPMAIAIEKVSALSGRAREDVVKEFTAMAKDGPTKFAEQANKSYNFLTVEQYRYIKQLEEQGRGTEALAVASQALNTKLGSLSDNLGLIERGWKHLQKEASGAWDAMMGVGRAETAEAALARTTAAVEQAQRKIEALRRTGGLAGGGGANNALNAALTDQAAAQETMRLVQRAAALRAQEAQKQAELIEADQKWGRIKDQNLKNQQRMNKELEAATELAKTRGKMDELPSVLSGIRDRYKGADGSAEAKQLADARFANERAALEGVAALEKRVVDDRIRTNEQLYRLGLLDVRSYYSTKTELEQANLGVQEKLINQELALARQREAQAKRPIDKLTTNTEVLRLQERLSEVQARKEAVRVDNANAKALKLKQEIDDLEKRLDSFDSDAIKAVFQQEIAGRGRIEQLKIDQIKDPEERERANLEVRRKKMMEVVNAASSMKDEDRLSAIKRINEEIGLENDALAERMKPGWKKMLDEWGNSAALMKTSYDQAIEGMLRSGEQEFVRSKGNIGSTFKAMLKELESDLLRFAYRNSIGQLLGGGGGGGGLLGSLLNFGGTSFNPFAGGGFTDVGGAGKAASSFLASIMHTGRGPYESTGQTRMVPSSTFARAPRFHQGVGPGERATIIRDEEGVFTPAQMKAMAPVGRGNGDVTVNLINQTGQNMQASARRNDDGTVEVMLRQVKEAVASDIANGEGAVFNAMQGRFGLRTAVA